MNTAWVNLLYNYFLIEDIPRQLAAGQFINNYNYKM